jgi:hypothetical protein
MVMDPVPSLEDLLWFFEVEPQGENDDWPRYWPYTQVSYSTKRGEWEYEVTLWPGGESVRLQAARLGDAAIRLDLKRVVTVDLERTPGGESLRIHFRADDPLGTLRLQLKPAFALSWAMNES